MNTYKTAPDPARCIVAITAAGAWHATQCKRPRGHGPDGDYCIQHARMLAEQEERKIEREAASKAHEARLKTAVSLMEEVKTLAGKHAEEADKRVIFNEMLGIVKQLKALREEGVYALSDLGPHMFAESISYGQTDEYVKQVILDVVLVAEGQEIEALRQELRGIASTAGDALIRRLVGVAKKAGDVE